MTRVTSCNVVSMLAGLACRFALYKGKLHYQDTESILRSGAQRVIGYLLREEKEGEGESKSLNVTLPTGKGIIASRLNLTPEHFSRILHELSQAGLIKVEGRTVHIPDIEKLRTYEV